MKTIVVVPIYKERLNDRELMCLSRNISVFHVREICFVCPTGLNTKFYSLFNVPYFEYFDKSFFKSTESYNRLIASQVFWNRFSDYDYVLICQTDAFAFYDDLEKWETLGYDYVGAPWMEHIFDRFAGDLFHNVGNGGFSLRKVDTYIKIFDTNKDLMDSMLDKGICEDVLLSLFLKNKGYELNIPDYKVASEFSLETTSLLDKSNVRLPFGCHKLWVYDNDLFMQFLKIID